MRRMITKSTTQNYNQFFRRMIGAKVKTLKEFQEHIEKVGDKLDGMPTDDDVWKGIHESQLVNKQAKGILFLLENRIRSNFHSTELKDFDDYSLEHVMPKKWRNKWDAQNLSEQEKLQRDKLLLTLGNLTLITSNLNSSIRDSDWDTKRKGRKTRSGLNEFAQGLDTFSSYLTRDEWNEEVIEERANMLIEHALTVWNVPEEFQQKFIPQEEDYLTSPDTTLYCNGAIASVGRGNRIIVKTGSIATGNIQPSFVTHNYNNERTALIEEGVLVESDGNYVFSKDYEFGSPSAAAAIVLGRSADGPNEWKDEHGSPLKAIRGVKTDLE